MHEYSIMKNIFDIVIEEAGKSNAKVINEITLVIGEQASYVDDSLLLYFNLLSKGTIAENAKLIINREGYKGTEFYIESIDID
jgi:hydrogenase nickel incorporation protein HypA/HybF